MATFLAFALAILAGLAVALGFGGVATSFGLLCLIFALDSSQSQQERDNRALATWLNEQLQKRIAKEDGQ